MSERLIIDKAIQHCHDIAATACAECAADHIQLANWLEEHQKYRDLGTVEELAALVEANRWIPVTERLPDEPTYEQTNMDDYDEYFVMISGATRPTALEYCGAGDFRDLNNISYAVTHWLPLPEGPGRKVYEGGNAYTC